MAGGRGKKLRAALRWRLDGGSSTTSFLQDLADEGDAEAAAELDRLSPGESAEIPPGCEMYLEAFAALQTDRPYVGMNGIPVRLPWSVVRAYADDLGLESGDRDCFHRLVSELDAEWLAWDAERRKEGRGG